MGKKCRDVGELVKNYKKRGLLRRVFNSVLEKKNGKKKRYMEERTRDGMGRVFVEGRGENGIGQEPSHSNGMCVAVARVKYPPPPPLAVPIILTANIYPAFGGY